MSQNDTTTGSAAHVTANPTEYGFTFAREFVHKNGVQLTPEVPIIVVNDVATFARHFPDVVRDALDGSSLRVQSQGHGRNVRSGDHGRDVSYDTICSTLVASVLFGARSKRPARVVTVAATAEQRAAMVAAMVDNGMDAAAALAVVNATLGKL